MLIDDLIGNIMDAHVAEIKQCVVDNILEETIGIVLECIAKDVATGKIRMEGLLDRDSIYDKSLEYMKMKREK